LPRRWRRKKSPFPEPFLLDAKLFPYTGISFLNAIGRRVLWLRKFEKYSINVLRVWSRIRRHLSGVLSILFRWQASDREYRAAEGTGPVQPGKLA